MPADGRAGGSGPSRAGLGRGRVFPAASAASLLNPLRRLIQPLGRVVRRLGLSAHDRVLEIGCGPGYFSAELAAAVPQGQLMLLDLQAAMLSRARQRAVGGVWLTQGDACALPFADASIDAALLVFVLGETPAPQRALAELARVLRPRGSVCVVESRRDSDFIPLSRLREQWAASGFELSAHWGWRWEYTARFRRRPTMG